MTDWTEEEIDMTVKGGRMDHDVSRLPKWAQDRIRVLEIDKARWKQSAQQVADGESNVYLRDYTGDGEFRRALPQNSHVIFVVEDGSIEVGFRDGTLDVRTEGLGANQRLAVFPVSSNVIEVAARP